MDRKSRAQRLSSLRGLAEGRKERSVDNEGQGSGRYQESQSDHHAGHLSDATTVRDDSDDRGETIYISVIDALAFFFQWRIWGPHRHRLTVVSHRGEEVFNCVPMGFTNSVGYVQRQLDNRLRAHRLYCRSYIDDILIASEKLEEHEKHLNDVFTDLERLHICLAPDRAFPASLGHFGSFGVLER